MVMWRYDLMLPWAGCCLCWGRTGYTYYSNDEQSDTQIALLYQKLVEYQTLDLHSVARPKLYELSTYWLSVAFKIMRMFNSIQFELIAQTCWYFRKRLDCGGAD